MVAYFVGVGMTQEIVQRVDVSGVPDLPPATLPESYLSARMMLAQCEKIDECQEWADKAKALASYAKQAGDKTLQEHASRIQLRAINRAGVLLKEFDATGRNQYEDTMGAHSIQKSQREAAADAGMSTNQQATAVQVANVPEAEFEAQVESANPPTVTAMAEQGKKKRLVDLGNIDPAIYREATELQGLLNRLAKYIENHNVVELSTGFQSHETVRVIETINQIGPWITNLKILLEESHAENNGNN